jgi:hypothetical protein
MTARASALALLAAVHAVGAQSTREVRFDAGAAQVQQTGREARDAAGVLGINWAAGTPRYAAMFAAAFTSAGDSASAAQAGLAAAWRPTDRSRWQTEGGTTVAAFGSTPLARGGSFSGNLRERVIVGAGGVFAGGAFGGTSRDGIASHSTAVELGASWRAGDFETTASATRAYSNDVALFSAAGLILQNGVASYTITDLAAELRYGRGPIVLDVTETVRAASHATTGTQTALYATAVWTITPRYSIAVGTGRQLADAVRGVPDVQVTSAALRIALIPPRTPAHPDMRGTSFASVTQKSSGALLLVSVVVDDTSLVEVAGTFSDWQPVQLDRTREGWEAEIALPPGRHKVAVRINGGPWQAPRGTAHVKDGFGGEAGLIVVP